MEESVELIKDNYKIFRYQGLDYDVVESYHINNSLLPLSVDAAQDTVEAIEFVMSSIVKFKSGIVGTSSGAEHTDSSMRGASTELEQLFESIRGSCRQYTRLGTRRDEYNRQRYNMFLSSLNIHETESVKGLTALAAGFLPLSLGASLPSMQTRFADLDYLIYDFVGVGVLLFSLMGVVYIAVKLVVRSAKWKPFGPVLLESLDPDNTEFTFTSDEADNLHRRRKKLRGVLYLLGHGIYLRQCSVFAS
jgi:hypothetical protein